MDYEPDPIDTSKVQLSDEIIELTEQLAENAHEVWAQQRKNEGWTRGPRRDQDEKRDPSHRCGARSAPSLTGRGGNGARTAR